MRRRRKIMARQKTYIHAADPDTGALHVEMRGTAYNLINLWLNVLNDLTNDLKPASRALVCDGILSCVSDIRDGKYTEGEADGDD
jgi:hypothetical protein